MMKKLKFCISTLTLMVLLVTSILQVSAASVNTQIIDTFENIDAKALKFYWTSNYDYKDPIKYSIDKTTAPNIGNTPNYRSLKLDIDTSGNPSKEGIGWFGARCYVEDPYIFKANVKSYKSDAYLTFYLKSTKACHIWFEVIVNDTSWGTSFDIAKANEWEKIVLKLSNMTNRDYPGKTLTDVYGTQGDVYFSNTRFGSDAFIGTMWFDEFSITGTGVSVTKSSYNRDTRATTPPNNSNTSSSTNTSSNTNTGNTASGNTTSGNNNVTTSNNSTSSINEVSSSETIPSENDVSSEQKTSSDQSTDNSDKSDVVNNESEIEKKNSSHIGLIIGISVAVVVAAGAVAVVLFLKKKHSNEV